MRILHIRVTSLFLNIFLGCILFSIFACGKENYTPKKYLGLKGKIVNIRDSVYNFPWGYKELGSVVITDFDTEGNVIKNINYNADSSFIDLNEYIYKENILYSKKGQMHAGKDVIIYTSERIATEDGTLKYKESNNDQQWIKEVKTNGKYHMEYSEGEYGHTKEEVWADNNNNIIKDKTVTVSNESKFPNGTYTYMCVDKLKYDKNGNVTESIRIEDKDTVATVYSYHQYDNYGNWTEGRLEINESSKNRPYKKLIKRTITYAE